MYLSCLCLNEQVFLIKVISEYINPSAAQLLSLTRALPLSWDRPQAEMRVNLCSLYVSLLIIIIMLGYILKYFQYHSSIAYHAEYGPNLLIYSQ